jgi:2,4-dienoyl-CoA reductase (NADPH2)
MSNEFPLLFSPFKLGSLTLKNRLVSSPHGTHMAIGGLTNQSDLEHHIRLAEGGVGLIISGGTVVHASSSLRNRRLVEAYNDNVLPGLHERSAAVHKEGAALICQLFHLGRELIGGE